LSRKAGVSKGRPERIRTLTGGAVASKRAKKTYNEEKPSQE